MHKTWSSLMTAVNYVPRTTLLIFGLFSTAMLGATMKGEWILIAISIYKEWELNTLMNKKSTDSATDTANSSAPNIITYHKALLENIDNPTQELLVQLRLENVEWFILGSIVVSFVSYYSLGGFLQYYYYIRQKDQASEWKCQPDKWLTKENERHEIFMGSCNMVIGSTVSGIIAAYIYNGGPCCLYFNPLERGWLYLGISMIATFLLQDGLEYYAHRAYHIPCLYKSIHKWHHRYNSPTLWSSTAMHPVEFFTYQAVLAMPIFVIPLYSGAYIMVLLYNYYHGLMAHSGIHMTHISPWQPPSVFHDDHHKYFHVNFGFNTYLFDWLHNTIRRDDKVYGEHIFGGRGLKKHKLK